MDEGEFGAAGSFGPQLSLGPVMDFSPSPAPVVHSPVAAVDNFVSANSGVGSTGAFAMGGDSLAEFGPADSFASPVGEVGGAMFPAAVAAPAPVIPGMGPPQTNTFGGLLGGGSIDPWASINNQMFGGFGW